MTITIELSSEEEQALKTRAKESGSGVTEFVGKLVKKEISTPTLSELLAPFRKQVDESGISDKELIDLFEEARDEAWNESNSTGTSK